MPSMRRLRSESMGKKRSEADELMQETKPKKGKPVEIPIPTKRDVLRDLTKVALHERRLPSVDEDPGEEG